MPKIVYDCANCEGFFVCDSSDPEDFEQAEDEDKVDLIGGKEVSEGLWEKEIDEEHLEMAKDACAGCPADVIKVLDDDGNVLEGPRELPIEQS